MLLLLTISQLSPSTCREGNRIHRPPTHGQTATTSEKTSRYCSCWVRILGRSSRKYHISSSCGLSLHRKCFHEAAVRPIARTTKQSARNVQFLEERLRRERKVPFVVCDPRAPTSKSSRSSAAKSPLTEAIALSETSWDAAQRHVCLPRINAFLLEPRRSSAQCSKPANC
jgi:hypothetical protein